jgi:predicted acylesterase/phospholipase RssA
VGWTAAGTRPEFDVVTGISTGALIAPFAFLGSAYDAQLKEVYTQYSTRDLVRKRYLIHILTGDSAVSTKPLQRLIARYFDKDVLKQIAEEYRKGRRLFVGTTNLDAGRSVIWNIGEILTSGTPNAHKLVHKILLASASIPVAFPPVFIDVEVDGTRYDEIHVDGGTASQVFLFPVGLDWKIVEEKFELTSRPNAYIIRNSQLTPAWETVQPKLFPIAGRSIGSLIKTQGIGDLYRLYLTTLRDNIDFNLAYIPSEFQKEAKEVFDREYMGELFDLAYRLAADGYPWKKTPPGIDEP